MNIVKTDILDSNLIENDQATKILLFDNLLEHFAPLFYEETRTKHGQFSNNVARIKKLKNTITEYKTRLLKLKVSLELESYKKKILDEIEILSNNSKIDFRLKNTITKIILTLDDQPLVGLKKRFTFLQRKTRELGEGKKDEKVVKRGV